MTSSARPGDGRQTDAGDCPAVGDVGPERAKPAPRERDGEGTGEQSGHGVSSSRLRSDRVSCRSKPKSSTMKTTSFWTDLRHAQAPQLIADPQLEPAVVGTVAQERDAVAVVGQVLVDADQQQVRQLGTGGGHVEQRLERIAAAAGVGEGLALRQGPLTDALSARACGDAGRLGRVGRRRSGRPPRARHGVRGRRRPAPRRRRRRRPARAPGREQPDAIRCHWSLLPARRT